MTTLRSLLNETGLPKNEARLLLAHLLEIHLQLPKSALLTHDGMEVSNTFLEEWQLLEQRRLQGEPIAYLMGKRGFHAIDLMVGPGVLIPRPETELLVDLGLDELNRIINNENALNESKHSLTILDLGTGSGAIALAIAASQPKVRVVATDASQAALGIAQQNAAHLKLKDRVSFCLGHWYGALHTPGNTHYRFDLILSNPPYIAANDPHLSKGDLRFEPQNALTDFGSGLTCLATIIDGALAHLKPGGLLAVEHGFDQSPHVLEQLALAGFQDITPHRDLAGHWRVASGRKPI
ncbi:peptide chain release factor N(5)-glutamine methyltransferase [Polynucleobacter sp.]|uniref:peptide chain release factor N(5)-glutamine methyltransferase n=1 Tax=Polynucleobacter sp. TaxID=2029855 RepID=UPI00273711AB|nr:peptide chain release factor N(5)-glutamine methyltransferase [Polynucleobacter sp.]MDP3122870.1 peptide chain release factor N(5)-glutamine methyltransferase [Polynucleobacter sp.]